MKVILRRNYLRMMKVGVSTSINNNNNGIPLIIPWVILTFPKYCFTEKTYKQISILLSKFVLHHLFSFSRKDFYMRKAKLTHKYLLFRHKYKNNFLGDKENFSKNNYICIYFFLISINSKFPLESS